jgi:hypothetical protein
MPKTSNKPAADEQQDRPGSAELRACKPRKLDLIAERLMPSTSVDEKLVDIIGRSLAAMLSEALAQTEGEAQRIVVRSAPVQKVGSFRGGGVDLSRFADHLVSCLAVVDKLVETGQLTLEEEQHARAYLEAREMRWATEVAIDDAAELYLDDLSVSYLNTAGVLDKIGAAGLKVFVSQHQVDEANALIGVESQPMHSKDPRHR